MLEEKTDLEKKNTKKILLHLIVFLTMLEIQFNTTESFEYNRVEYNTICFSQIRLTNKLQMLLIIQDNGSNWTYIVL